MKNKIEKIAKDLGASIVGFGNMEGLLSAEHSHLKTGISIAVRLSDQVLNDVKDKPTETYYHHYRTVNFLIDQICLRISMEIQNEGYLSMAVPASQTVKSKTENYKGLISHKMVATRSGIGWIGKSACLVTEKYGPRVRLGTIVTDMIVEYDEPVESSRCGNCMECVKNCPSLAITGNEWDVTTKREDLYDAFACSTHMSEAYREIGRGSVCGICLSCCPYGKKKDRT
jgi:epoxyqueuosine reductase